LSEIYLLLSALIILFGLGSLAAFLPPLKQVRPVHLSLGLAILGGLVAAYAGFYFWRQPMASPEIILAVEPLLEPFPPLPRVFFLYRLGGILMVKAGLI
jgi:hypothetical protein